MKIKYLVSHIEIVGQSIRTIKQEEFDNVEDAIDYHQKQKDSFNSWWEINVRYSK